jgi:hypothetical protein
MARCSGRRSLRVGFTPCGVTSSRTERRTEYFIYFNPGVARTPSGCKSGDIIRTIIQKGGFDLLVRSGADGMLWCPFYTPISAVSSWGWWLHATSASGRRAPATEHIWMPKSTLIRRWVSPGACLLEVSNTARSRGLIMSSTQ